MAEVDGSYYGPDFSALSSHGPAVAREARPRTRPLGAWVSHVARFRSSEVLKR